MQWNCEMNKSPGVLARMSMRLSWAVILITFAAGGCELAMNPFVDPLAEEPEATTASAEAARAFEREREVRRRSFAENPLIAADGSVTHGPSYFEDPREEPTSECAKCAGRFAWGWEDIAASIYGPGRFLVNGVLSPLSKIVAPPWTVMVSDGVAGTRFLSERYDARRAE